MLHIHWQVKAELPEINGSNSHLGVAGPVTGVLNNILLVAGGANFPDKKPWYGGKKAYHKTVYLFAKNDHNEIISAESGEQQLPAAIAYAANIAVPDGLVIAGGENESGIKDQVIKISMDKALKISFSGMASLPVPLTNASGVYHNGFLYVLGGETENGTSNKLYRFNTSMPHQGWQTMADMPAPKVFAVVTIQSNGAEDCIYVMGGRSKIGLALSNVYNTVYCYSILQNTWMEKNKMPNTLSAGTGLALGNDAILFVGGDEGPLFLRLEILNRDISAAQSLEEKERLTSEKLDIVENHPGFSKQIWLYHTVTDQYTALNDFPEGSSVTTMAMPWGDEVVIPSGEMRPGARTPKIWMGSLR